MHIRPPRLSGAWAFVSTQVKRSYCTQDQYFKHPGGNLRGPGGSTGGSPPLWLWQCGVVLSASNDEMPPGCAQHNRAITWCHNAGIRCLSVFGPVTKRIEGPRARPGWSENRTPGPIFGSRVTGASRHPSASGNARSGPGGPAARQAAGRPAAGAAQRGPWAGQYPCVLWGKAVPAKAQLLRLSNKTTAALRPVLSRLK